MRTKIADQYFSYSRNACNRNNNTTEWNLL